MSLEAILTQIELQKLNVLAEFVGKGAQFKICWDFFYCDWLFVSFNIILDYWWKFEIYIITILFKTDQ